ncbi:hypothetical protein CH63R_09825 [Colletotrichum higginsianum IMI 349063]|uniref:Uncharacterized protein n=1 Tax=Colletotrichum higginsianum (strain IMI 349063) TaxID=759273 RepID=A0A1B7Y126_COLHI|nr:uncharacterized protein CH63R_09825 [Colletotrichum higginsianum IMI 349063]OBR05705.1 hypothetical protein CH63R_09825 [Colletotrichum higginsianum IMI 349063]
MNDPGKALYHAGYAIHVHNRRFLAIPCGHRPDAKLFYLEESLKVIRADDEQVPRIRAPVPQQIKVVDGPILELVRWG